MRKDFVKVMLFGALALSTVTFVGCNDYDDDIKNLQEQIDANKTQIASLDAAIKAGKWVKEYTATATGYELTLSDGSKLTLTNGAKGDKGDTGLQGIQGPAGESVVPTFRVNGVNWQYSVDKGTTWIDVKDENGNPVKAKGEDGKDATSNVTWQEIDGVSYIKIGDVLTDLKAINKFPVMIADETTKTIAVTIDGQTYTLLMEGSVFKGLQTIAFRPLPGNDENSLVRAYYIVNTDLVTSKETLVIPAVGAVSFKVYPGDWNPSDAEFSFIDTYKTRAANIPAVKYLDGSAKVNGNILSILMQPVNFQEAHAGGYSDSYATSLDVKMYNQYVSASEYFNIRTLEVTRDELVYVETPEVKGDYDEISEDQQKEMVTEEDKAPHFSFEYNKTYNLNDSIDVMINDGSFVSLKELAIDYTIKYAFTDRNWENKPVDNGIFELKDGILSVKKEHQSSAINEFAYIKATCTIKSQVEGVEDMVIEQNLAIYAGRNTQTESVELTLNAAAAGQAWDMTYSAEAQYLVLDVRKFEAEMGGRDLLNGNNDPNNSWVMPLSTGSASVSTVEFTGDLTTKEMKEAVAHVATKVAPGNIVLYFKAAPNNSATSLDSLFLIVGKSTKLNATKLWVANDYDKAEKGKISTIGGSLINKHIFVNEASITRTPTIKLKDATYKETIVGKYVGTTILNWKLWEVASDNVYDAYTIKPADVKVGFKLADSEKQNDYVKQLIADGRLSFSSDNKITITPTGNTEAEMVDIAKIGNIYLEAYDLHTMNITASTPGFNPVTQLAEILLANAKIIADKGNRTWTVQNPYKAVTSKGDVTYTDNTLTTGSTYASYTKNLKDAGLKDAYDTELIKGSETIPFLVISDYAKKVYGFDVWKFSIGKDVSSDVKNDWSINSDTGVLTCKKANIGAGYSITIPVEITFPSNFGHPAIKFNVKITNAAN